jgi:hypothetical protein
MDQYVDSHYSNEEMQQLPHTPASFMGNSISSYGTYQHHPGLHRSGYNTSEPFKSPERTPYDFHPEHSSTAMSRVPPSLYPSYRGESDVSDYSPTSESLSMIRVYPEVVYNMQLASGSGESGYHGFDGISSSSTNSTNPRTPSRHGGYSHGRTQSNTSVGSLNAHRSYNGDLGLPDAHMTTSAHPRYLFILNKLKIST